MYQLKILYGGFLVDHRIKIFNTYVDNFTMEETLSEISKIIDRGIPTQHVVLNASKINMMKENTKLTEIVNSCSVINADGASILWAAKKFKKPLKERVTGIDLFQNLLNISETKGYSIYLFGATEEVVCVLKEKLMKEYPLLKIVGYRNGYFKDSQSHEIAKEIASKKPDLLFVAFSSPMKEYWISEHLNILNTPFVMGVGGSFDVLAGKTKRAPKWMQQSGLEWFYRFIQEPIRMWNRYIIGNFKFVIYTLKETKKLSANK